jgi:hypothetical protein
MARVAFTPNLQRHLPCPPTEARGADLRAVLDAVFADNPPLRSYILDDQGRLRRHVVIFLNNEPVRDRIGLSDPVREEDEVFVFQALSGG